MADKSEKIILKGRLSGTQRNRLTRLLDMLYKPSELAEEVGFTRRQVYRVYIPVGCPHTRDEKRYIWINGKAFREWYEETYPRISLAKNETFCMTCKKPVKIINPTKEKKGRLHYLISYCPNCGRKLARITKKDKLYK
jgi:Zn finger protein HypA/HybF involved in hydrogenase expression